MFSQVFICVLAVISVISYTSAGLLNGGGGGGGDHAEYSHGYSGGHMGGYAAQPAPVEEKIIQVVQEQVKSDLIRSIFVEIEQYLNFFRATMADSAEIIMVAADLVLHQKLHRELFRL